MKFSQVRTDPKWGEVYAGPEPAYMTDRGPVWMHRGSRNRVRFYDVLGVQRGPEQPNVAPAVAYAQSHRWGSM